MEDDMPGYTITVVRSDYRRVSVPIERDDLGAVVGQALDKARTLALNGCPFGDAQPPRCVEIADSLDALVLRIMVDASLIPLAP
jgi:hypothetical protein